MQKKKKEKAILVSTFYGRRAAKTLGIIVAREALIKIFVESKERWQKD